MPLYNKEDIYGVLVPMKGGTPLTCVFGSKQDMTGLATDLGILSYADAAAIPAIGVFTGANSPIPPTGSKAIGVGQKRKSSYCDASIAMTHDDVDIRYPKNRARAIHTVADTALVVSVFVELDGINRAWNMAKTQYALISGDFGELGIEECTDADALDYVWGCQAPFPARVKTFKSGGADGGDTHITFCAESKENNLVTWTKISNRITVARYFGADDIVNIAP